MSEPMRWGILGAGKISRKFATGLLALPEARLVAIGSESAERARAFAAEFNIPRAYPGYAELVNDPELDVVYVGTHNPAHASAMRLCLEAGKPVLCEKPFSINASEAEAVIRLARARRLFLMEGMWTRFFPLVARMRELLAAGAIGDLRRLEVDFGFRCDATPDGRWFNPALGGGALLDVGVYGVSFASMVLGPPREIVSLAQLGSTGVDEQCAMVLSHEAGRLALVSASLRMETTKEARLFGTEGSVVLHNPFWRPVSLSWSRADGSVERVGMPYTGNGFNYEAAEVMRCLREGRLESQIMPLDETLAVMRTLDTLRRQWGLKYPMEA